MDLRCGVAVAAQHRERGRENYVGDLGWAADSCGAACRAVEAETTAAPRRGSAAPWSPSALPHPQSARRSVPVFTTSGRPAAFVDS